MAFLRALASYVPRRVVTNAELAARLGCEPDWIERVSGIRERRWADTSETVADMGAHAASECLARAGSPRIGLAIVASGSAEKRFPGPAAELAAAIGLNGIPAIDVPMASAGSLFGLAMAAQLSGSFGRVLLVASEKMSAAIQREPMDKNTAILFGDGAGACLIDPEEGEAALSSWCLHSDGAFTGALSLDYGQPIHMDGRTVILQAARKVPASIRELLEAAQIPAPAICAFLMHQANQNLIVKIAQALEVAPEKFYSNIARFGNTSSASMLIAAAEWSAHGGFRRGEPVVFAAFGAGFHWGALLAIGS